jgi:hypothetical protein
LIKQCKLHIILPCTKFIHLIKGKTYILSPPKLVAILSKFYWYQGGVWCFDRDLDGVIEFHLGESEERL